MFGFSSNILEFQNVFCWNMFTFLFYFFKIWKKFELFKKLLDFQTLFVFTKNQNFQIKFQKIQNIVCLYTNVCWFHWLAAQVHEMEVVCSNPTRHPFHALFFFHHSCSATAPTIGPAQSRGLCVRRLAVRRKMRRIGAPDECCSSVANPSIISVREC